MTLDDALNDLQVIRHTLGTLLDERGRFAVEQAHQELQMQKEALRPVKGKKRKRKRKIRAVPFWDLEIPVGNPVVFKPCDRSQDVRFPLEVDLSCKISKLRNGRPSKEHNVLVRLWTDDETVWFRRDWDASRLENDIRDAGRRRVMLRFHFDFANPSQPGPAHHLQIGGNPEALEHFWIPKSLRVPRFCHHPMSLIMVCEFIVRTFFPNDYDSVRDERTWKGAIARAQREYLGPYYDSQQVTIQDDQLGRSLLDSLWNKT